MGIILLEQLGKIMWLKLLILSIFTTTLICQSLPNGKIKMDPKNKNDSEWKESLSPLTYKVLRQKGTESHGSGKYYHYDKEGIYYCGGCGSPLFDSRSKYDSGSGWPSFWEPVDSSAVSKKSDYSLFMRRIEIQCSKCDGHLGHVFEDGPQPTGLRYCINSAALNFRKSAETED